MASKNKNGTHNCGKQIKTEVTHITPVIHITPVTHITPGQPYFLHLLYLELSQNEVIKRIQEL